MAVLIVGPFFEPYLWGLAFQPLPLCSLFYGWAALGGYLIGKTVGRHRLLRLDGLPELGIAAFALVFVLLLKSSPLTCFPLAQLAVTSLESFLRITFAFIFLSDQQRL